MMERLGLSCMHGGPNLIEIKPRRMDFPADANFIVGHARFN